MRAISEEKVPAPKAIVIGGQFNIAALEVPLQEQIKHFDDDLRKAMHAFTDATLKMGEALSGIQEILEPRGAFTAYLKSLPGLSRATAYRYIGYFTNLQKRLPEPILERVVSAGLPMTSTNEKQPFGRYTKVMKKVPLPKGILTPERADAWVADLQAKYRSTRSTAQAKKPDALAEEVSKFVLRRFNKVPDSDRLAWLRDVLRDVGTNVGLDISVSLKTEEPAHKAVQAGQVLEDLMASGRPATGKGTSPRVRV